MAQPFDINLTDGAQADLQWFAAYAQRIIVDGMRVVTVQAVGEKRGNTLLIRGQEFTEHESN